MNRTSETRKSSAPGLVADTEGAVFVEYVTVTLLVSLGCAAGIYAMGAPLLARFRFIQTLVMFPIP